MRALVVVVATVGIAFSCSSYASAAVPIDVEIAGKFGTATKPSADVTALGIGIGARAGVEIMRTAYFGVTAMNYFGSNNEGSSPGNGHAYVMGLEAGYSAHLGVLTLRPQIGVGVATFFESEIHYAPCGTPGSCAAWSPTESSVRRPLYFEPGLTALVTIRFVQIGVNASLLVIPGLLPNPYSTTASTVGVSFVTGLQAGVRF